MESQRQDEIEVHCEQPITPEPAPSLRGEGSTRNETALLTYR